MLTEAGVEGRKGPGEKRKKIAPVEGSFGKL